MPATLTAATNYLTFSSLEANFTGRAQPLSSGFAYAPQLTPPGTDTVTYAVD